MSKKGAARRKPGIGAKLLLGVVTMINLALTLALALERREVVRETCAWAAAQGADIQFVDGAELLGEAGRECCTVDGIHPNDLGFWRMARAVYPYVRAALERHGEGSTILGEEGTRR